MIVDNKAYTGDGSTRQFATSVAPLSNSHIAVFLDSVLQGTDTYDLLGSVVLFKIAPLAGVHIVFSVSDTGEDLPTTPNAYTLVAGDIANINILAEYIKTGSTSIGSGGQFLGTSTIKGIQYMAQKTNENLTVLSGTNAFSIDSFTVENGGSINLEDNAVYKII